MSASCDDQSRGALPPSLALYVHIPFCRARCAYCDFNTYAGLEELMPLYVEGLRREIESVGERWGQLGISTVYVGGGTPSLLPLGLVADLFDVLHATWNLSECVEITVEANPGAVNATYLSGLRALGVDRLSIGAQAAHEEELRMLGRIHSWNDVARAVEAARRASFKNLSLDLLFGLPDQSLSEWRETLEEALKLHPEHLSLYGLSVEEGTPLAARIANEDLVAPDEDRAATMYELAEALLAEAGFFHYEISNWAKIDRAALTGDRRWWPIQETLDLGPEMSETISSYVCHHNLTYWRNEPWLGVGAGAWSWMTPGLLTDTRRSAEGLAEGKRWANVDHPKDFVDVGRKAARSTPWRQDVERIGRRLEMGETMMLGLRLAEGVRADRFRDRFDVELADVFGEELNDLHRLGLVTWDNTIARLTRRGRLLGNRAFGRFV